MDGRKPQQYKSRPRVRMFETRSQAWREVGLLRQISPRAIRRARIQALLLIPLFAGVVYVYDRYVSSKALLGKEFEVPVRIVAVIILVALGWVIARALGRVFGPPLFRRLEPATAGTVGFLIRLTTVVGSLVVALRIAGLEPRTLALGGAVTAVILGLAAQQTLGNVIAGTVMLSTRPFRVGDKVRLQGGYLGGQVDGVVSSLGLFYTTFEKEDESILIPNSLVMNALVISGEEADYGEAEPYVDWTGAEAASSPAGEDADRPPGDQRARESS